MTLSPFPEFTQAEREAVKEAVDAAEGRTSGEIVPYVVATSDRYPEAAWQGATIAALLSAVLGAGLVMAFDLWSGPWAWPWLFWIVGSMSAAAALGYSVTSAVPSLKRRLLSSEVLEARVADRAAVAFLEEGVFATDNRTGILLFLSLFERRVLVLGDEGINRRVDTAEWQGLVDDLAAGIRQGRAADALLQAIARCGAVLDRKGVDILADDRNELSDDLRIRET